MRQYIYIPGTHTVIIADIFEFLPEQIPFPKSTNESYLKQTLGDLAIILKNKQKLNIPTEKYGDVVENALLELSNILNRQNITQIISPSLQTIPQLIQSSKKLVMAEFPPKCDNENITPTQQSYDGPEPRVKKMSVRNKGTTVTCISRQYACNRPKITKYYCV